MSPLILNDKGYNVFAIAICYGATSTAKWIYKHWPESSNISPSDGNNLLHLAVVNDHAQIITWLFNKNLVDPRHQNDSGYTPFDVASSRNHQTSMKLIKENLGSP